MAMAMATATTKAAASPDMQPQRDPRNGDGDDDGSSDSEGSAGSGSGSGSEELRLEDAAWPARALAALNALRKARQHFDAVLLAQGEEVAAHRAVLAAASPRLLAALQAPAAAPALRVRVRGVRADALRDLVDFAYTGRAHVRDASAARRLYCAAWRLRVEPLRAQLGERLLRRPAPPTCVALRALPGLAPEQLGALDAYIADNFESVCSCGALAELPLLRVELLRESSREDGAETPLAVAEAALAWLRERGAGDHDLEELCSRTHLLFVNARGALRDCGELPEAHGDAAGLREYRREAARRLRRDAAPDASEGAGADADVDVDAAEELGGREPAAAHDYGVIAARSAGGATRALLAVRGGLAVARVAWREAGAGGPAVARGGALGAGEAEPAGGPRRAPMPGGRCALGAAALQGRLVVCGGYDRARALRDALAYEPGADAWRPLAPMRCARARFPAARLRGALYVLGGSDGHAELASVDALEGGAWRARAPLPLAVSHAAAAADEAGGALYAVGGWAGGAYLRRVLRYSPDLDAWTDAPPLITGRSQCAAVWWEGALWALGGCDAWHCLASTERLAPGAPAWEKGPALPTARRSVGAASWRGALVAAGGSDGAQSLRRTEWLAPGADAWRPGPPLRRARAALALVDLSGALYAVAGFDGKDFLACVECLYDPAGEWTSLRDPPPIVAPPSPPSPPSPSEPPSASSAPQ